MFDLTERVIGAAIEVHRELGPGLLESTYQDRPDWESSAIVEIESVERLDPIHSARMMYMKLASYRSGLIFNFNG